jgi:poly-gamma-glutamate synthesis protein (capsule biosynthesis protein)
MKRFLKISLLVLVILGGCGSKEAENETRNKTSEASKPKTSNRVLYL